MGKQKGFTLIELIIVIIILGVLAVTAAPKFIDITSDARIATLDGMKGALESGTNMIFYKALIKKKNVGAATLTVDGINILVHGGYPIGSWQSSMRYIVDLDDVEFSINGDTVCTSAWCGKGNQQSLPSGITRVSPIVIGKVFPEGYSFDDECGVYYINNLDGNKPEIGIETDDC